MTIDTWRQCTMALMVGLQLVVTEVVTELVFWGTDTGSTNYRPSKSADPASGGASGQSAREPEVQQSVSEPCGRRETVPDVGLTPKVFRGSREITEEISALTAEQLDGDYLDRAKWSEWQVDFGHQPAVPQHSARAASASSSRSSEGDASDTSERSEERFRVLSALADVGGFNTIMLSGIACQPHSRAGDGHGMNDHRAQSLPKTLRLAWLLQCTMLVLECVPEIQKDVKAQEMLRKFANATGAALSENRVKTRGLFGVLVPLGTTQVHMNMVMTHCRYLHPQEMWTLLGGIPGANFGHNLRLAMSGIGQAVSPLIGLWVLAQVKQHLDVFFERPFPCVPAGVLREHMQELSLVCLQWWPHPIPATVEVTPEEEDDPIEDAIPNMPIRVQWPGDDSPAISVACPVGTTGRRLLEAEQALTMSFCELELRALNQVRLTSLRLL
eukprot:s4718_g3.t1